jgi:metal-dependent amidase/aminoacylase/carboxypeptidase family protein
VSAAAAEWHHVPLVHHGIGKTGVVGRLRGGNSTRSVGLRAVMDALPIQEANTCERRSQSE